MILVEAHFGPNTVAKLYDSFILLALVSCGAQYIRVERGLKNRDRIFLDRNWLGQVTKQAVVAHKVRVRTCSMNPGMIRWKVEFRNPNPFSPLHRHRKFSTVRGTTSARSSMMMRPTADLPILMSKYTWGFLRDFFSSGWNETIEISKSKYRLKFYRKAL